MKIFSGCSNKPLAEKVAKQLGREVSPLDIHIFPDGERRVRVLDSVVDEDTVVVQSCVPPVDTNYMELFFIVDALKRSGAKSVTAVIPYLGYQRQDHVFRSGEAVSLEVIVRTLESIGVGKIIVFDLHSIKTPELFRIPVSHLSALPLFAGKIREIGYIGEAVLVSPDMGGVRRVKLISEMLDNMPQAAIVKNRNLQTGEVTAEQVQGVLTRRAIIVDDMISSGATIFTAAALLKEKGVEEVVVFATHPVFSENAPTVLQDCLAEKVFVSDTIDVPEKKRFAKLEVLSVAKIIAEEIRKQ